MTTKRKQNTIKDWTKAARIDWKACTSQNLYMLQYYGNTAYIRRKAKAELLSRK